MSARESLSDVVWTLLETCGAGIKISIRCVINQACQGLIQNSHALLPGTWCMAHALSSITDDLTCTSSV